MPAILRAGVSSFNRNPAVQSIVVRAGDDVLVLPLPTTFDGPVVGYTPFTQETLRILSSSSPLIFQYGKEAVSVPALSTGERDKLWASCA
jgi:hypothetical protein